MTIVPRLAPATLSERLLPLRGKRRGDPIQADDWNTIVQACLSILEMVQNEQETARARLEASFARSDHEHVGAVTLSWLDPELQQRIGSAVDAAGRGVVATLEKKVDALAAEVKALQDANATLESRLDRLAASDVDRTLTIRNLGKRFETFGDFGIRLEKLNTDVVKLAPKIDDVFKLRDALTDEEGKTIKLLDVRADVKKLERLGGQLTGIDGTPVKITDLQQQIRDLRDVAGVGQGLEPRLATLSAELDTRLNDKLQIQVLDLRKNLVAEQENKVAISVATKFTEAVSLQNNTLSTRFNEIETKLTQTVGATVLGTVKSDLETRGKAIDDKLATVGTLVTTALGSARPDIERAVRDSVTPVALQEVKNAVGTFETRLNDRVKTIDATVTTLKDRLPNDISVTVKELTGTVRTELLGTVDTKVKETRDSILAVVPTAAKDAAASIIGNLDARITTAVTGRVGDLDVRVKTAVDRATVDLPKIAESFATVAVAKLDVPALVTRATDQVEQRITTSVGQRFQAEQINRTNDINRTVVALRGEIVATAKGEVEVLRKEQDKRLKTVEERPVTILNPRPLPKG